MNYAAITRRIRRCENEETAQIVLERAIREEVESERAACVGICDALHETWRFGDGEDSASGPMECAAAIRERAAK